MPSYNRLVIGEHASNLYQHIELVQGCVFTKDINKAMMISDAMETGTVQINSAPARGPDHFPFQVNPP